LHGRWNGIVAAFGEGMAAEEAANAQGQCEGERVCVKAFERILRTGGLVPTGAGCNGEKAHQGRQQMLVDPNQKSGQDTECVIHFGEGIDHCFFCGILSKNRNCVGEI